MEQILRKLPIGVQSFESLRNDEYLYVDKTKYIYLLARYRKQYFLSRPRRFGKSLLLSTMKAYWEGKKDMFQGLEIEKLEADDKDAFRPYPVFYFDFNRDRYQEPGSLEQVLETHLSEWEKLYGCDSSTVSLTLRFQNLLKRANERTGMRCVVLVDEYDKPLLEVMSDKDQENHNKSVFKGFFSSLKSYDQYLKFVFITGVTKFSKISIFSDLNQLNDISLDDDYKYICGITEEELCSVFLPEIKKLSNAQSLSIDACLKKLQKTYDGYRFSQSSGGVYNPFSLLKALYSKRFGSYWFETGTPSFLTRRLKKIEFDVHQFSDQTLYASETMLSDYQGDHPDPVPLLYQTGYLTIIDYDRQKELYTLGFPNEEVKYGLLESLLPEYVSKTANASGKDIYTLDEYVEKGNLEGMHSLLTSLFASIPYTGKDTPFEHYFQTVLYLVFTLLGKYAFCEVHTYTGRIDCIVETKEFIYLFEFKRDKSADDALQQIEDMGYALPYSADQRKLYKIGVNFDSEKRMLTEWRTVP